MDFERTLESRKGNRRREAKMVIGEVSVVPVGTQTPSVSKYVAKALGVLKEEKNIKYELTAMGTILEGDLDALLEAVKKMHECLFDGEVKRVMTTVKIDDRRDKRLSMSYKVRSVLEKV